MRISTTKPLFAWGCLDDSPSLRTVKEFLAVVPDAELLEGLRLWRGRGRNDYPVHVLWGVVLLTALLRHSSFEACLGELERNAGLRRLIGIKSAKDVPKKWNISRFLDVLGQGPHGCRLQAIFDQMVQKLGRAVPDLGRNTAGDSTWLNARRKSNGSSVEAEQAEGLPQPAGGRQEYTDEEGKVTKVVEWFGYKLHLLVDVKHEVSPSYKITSTKAGDGETLPELLDEAQANLSENRIKTLAYDKAADSNPVHRVLHKARITPLIQNRSLWKDEHQRMLPGHDGRSNIVYDEAGTVYCCDTASRPLVRRRMAYIGHEPRRKTLKYRCLARHNGLTCPSESICNAGRKYGKTVRVIHSINPASTATAPPAAALSHPPQCSPTSAPSRLPPTTQPACTRPMPSHTSHLARQSYKSP